MGVAIKYINLIQFLEDMLLCLMTPKGKGKKNNWSPNQFKLNVQIIIFFSNLIENYKFIIFSVYFLLVYIYIYVETEGYSLLNDRKFVLVIIDLFCTIIF